MAEDFREPFVGRYFGIICVESDDPSPRMMFPGKGDAEAELARRKALDSDHDDWLSDDYIVLPVDVAGALWNCFDPDPRADNPLGVREIAALHEGPDEAPRIESAEDFIKALGDAIEEDKLPGVLGLDDVETTETDHVLALVLADDAETKISLLVGRNRQKEAAHG